MNNRLYHVIKKQIITEKTNALQAKNKVVFKVIKDATAGEVKHTIETLFDIKVEKVNMLNYKEKKVGVRRSRTGTHASYKKAVVTLKDGYTIENLKI